MFYMSADALWHWKMNAARAMGNSLKPVYVTDLIRAFKEIPDDRVKSMVVWALGRIGGSKAKAALKKFLPESAGAVREEIQEAIEASKNNILNR